MLDFGLARQYTNTTGDVRPVSTASHSSPGDPPQAPLSLPDQARLVFGASSTPLCVHTWPSPPPSAWALDGCHPHTQ